MPFTPALRFLRRSAGASRARKPDPADMGTVFGLEESLGRAEVQPAAGESHEPQAPQEPLDNPMAWLLRAKP
jgi:hypothetical protein